MQLQSGMAYVREDAGAFRVSVARRSAFGAWVNAAAARAM